MECGASAPHDAHLIGRHSGRNDKRPSQFLAAAEGIRPTRPLANICDPATAILARWTTVTPIAPQGGAMMGRQLLGARASWPWSPSASR